MAYDVFLSHSARDRETADAVSRGLERKGLGVWMASRDVSPEDAFSTVNYEASIIAAIAGARVVVLVFSSNARMSPQVWRDVARAFDLGIAIIALRVEDLQPSGAAEFFTAIPYWLDAFVPPFEEHLEGLAATVKHLLDHPLAAARARAAPFPGAAGVMMGLVLYPSFAERSVMAEIERVRSVAPYRLSTEEMWRLGRPRRRARSDAVLSGLLLAGVAVAAAFIYRQEIGAFLGLIAKSLFHSSIPR